jgi:hypothetical protein
VLVSVGLKDAKRVEPIGETQALEAFGLLPKRPGPPRLVLDAAELSLDLFDDVVDAGEVVADSLELALGLALLFKEPVDASGFFEDQPALLWAGAQQAVYLALFDEAVGTRADARVQQQVADVLEAALLAVEAELALAGAVNAAANAYLLVVDSQPAVGVVDDQLDLGEVERLARLAAGEDDVGHFSAAQLLSAPLTQDPLYGVDNVALAGAVRADQGR